jgi:hypothetical protein
MGPISHKLPFSMLQHNNGVLFGKNQTPPQFFPSQEPLNSDMSTNLRSIFKRTTGVSSSTTIIQNEFGKLSRPTAKYSFATQTRTPVSTHINYVTPISSSMHITKLKSLAIGTSTYLNNTNETSSKSYSPNDAKRAEQRSRSGGCVAPKKKGTIYW